MREYGAEIMVTVLRKDYPEIAEMITGKIKDTLPSGRLDDLSNVERIITSFKKIKSIEVENWTNGKGKVNITYERELLLGVLMLFYDPEQIMQFVKRNTVPGLLKQVSTLIGTTQKVLSMSTPNVIVAFKAYPDFREEVYRLYDLIITENKFFE